jgi:hypothetical protein
MHPANLITHDLTIPLTLTAGYKQRTGPSSAVPALQFSPPYSKRDTKRRSAPLVSVLTRAGQFLLLFLLRRIFKHAYFIGTVASVGGSLVEGSGNGLTQPIYTLGIFLDGNI